MMKARPVVGYDRTFLVVNGEVILESWIEGGDEWTLRELGIVEIHEEGEVRGWGGEEEEAEKLGREVWAREQDGNAEEGDGGEAAQRKFDVWTRDDVEAEEEDVNEDEDEEERNTVPVKTNLVDSLFGKLNDDSDSDSETEGIRSSSFAETDQDEEEEEHDLSTDSVESQNEDQDNHHHHHHHHHHLKSCLRYKVFERYRHDESDEDEGSDTEEITISAAQSDDMASLPISPWFVDPPLKTTTISDSSLKSRLEDTPEDDKSTSISPLFATTPLSLSRTITSTTTKSYLEKEAQMREKEEQETRQLYHDLYPPIYQIDKPIPLRDPWKLRTPVKNYFYNYSMC
ncbi:hypothetical protein I302_107140 [Kwoniella bestiolae CBS 10118]|uniref:Uncharacterized protein n=1 Tax=Kwoniella bestiolae CBS 10118 TaxID=1296100 RepID=A0A1B9FZD4_9TREE|nr:hypothetical protein I302_05594 [Kwoniella bestiolae CBS 10118]OCF24136.1 hypothetical protein I302_05594 [Kwoniella bestiolae CBS 10118]